MKKCLYSKCGKEFEPNKPKQKFCSDIHRVYHNRELKRAIPTAKDKEYVKKIAQIVFNLPAANPRDLSRIKGMEYPVLINGVLEAEIAAIKDEKIPVNRDTPNGRKSWAFDQQKRINDLKSKLK